jgi:hypothetical protein
MRSSFYFHITITILFSLLLIAFGIFFVILPSAPEFKHHIIAFLESNSALIQFLGLLIAIIGLILLISSFFVNRRDHYLVVYENKGCIVIDEDILEQYVSSYFATLFPDSRYHVESKIKDSKIHLVADLQGVAKESQKILLETIENDLNRLFSDKLGYKNDFYLSISFT